MLESVANLNTLIDYRYQQHFKAQNGRPGAGQNKTGADGHSIVLKVPIGTQVIDEDHETLLLDMVRPDQRVVFLRGGDGGFGNAHYKTSTNRAPRRKDDGWPGSERWVWLRLKLIADVGLIGSAERGEIDLPFRGLARHAKGRGLSVHDVEASAGCGSCRGSRVRGR